MNIDNHELLIAHGYSHTHYPETWEDVGNGESGPMLDGGPAYEEYASSTEYLLAREPGEVDAREPRNHEWEMWLDKQMGGQ